MNTPVPPKFTEDPYLSESPRNISLGVGVGLTSALFVWETFWGDVSDDSAPALQGRGKKGAIGCGGFPLLDGSRGVTG